MIHIESPVKGYTGISAGIGFALGKALVPSLTETQKRYFEKRGYIINEKTENTVNPEVVETSEIVGEFNTSSFADPSMIE